MNITGCRIEQGLLILQTADPDAKKLADGFKPGEYDIVPSKKNRSRNANDYMWALATNIANAVRISKEEVYRDAIKNVGVYKDFHDIRLEDAQSLITAWQMLGTGWIAEQLDWEPDGEHGIIRAYYGSSQYNTRQMSVLIDWMTVEAKNLGIETLDDMKVKSLLEDWDAQRVRCNARQK